MHSSSAMTTRTARPGSREVSVTREMSSMYRPSDFVEQPMVTGEERELDPARRAHLVEDVHQMALDGVLTDREAAPDFLVGVAVDHRPHDFLFPTGQPEHLRLSACGGEPAHAGGNVRRALVADPVVAGHHALDALEQQIGA